MTAPLSDKALAEIEAGLEGVTPGPWEWDDGSLRQNRTDGQYGFEVLGSGSQYESMVTYVDVRDANAAHIARLDPQTVAAWIARDKTQRARIAELVSASRDRSELWVAILPHGRRCRDCADYDGRCQGTGHPCDPQEHALEIISGMKQRIAELEAELAAEREYYHAGSVNALASRIGDMKLVANPDLHWRDKEEK